MATPGVSPLQVDLTQEGLPIPEVKDLVPEAVPVAPKAPRRNPFSGLLSNRKAAIGAAILLIFRATGNR